MGRAEPSNHRAALKTTFREKRKLSLMEGEALELFHPGSSTSITRWECCTPGEPWAEAPAPLQEQPSSSFLLQLPGTAARNKCIRIILPCQEEGERGLSERLRHIWCMNERGMADGGGLLPGVCRVWGRFLSLLKTFASCKVQAEPSLPFLEQPERERWWIVVGWDFFFNFFFCTAFPYKCI